jgi:hypothetical protein
LLTDRGRSALLIFHHRACDWRQLGQTEIEDFGIAATGNKDVCGFDVAVNDTGGVGGFEGGGDIDGDAGKRFCFEGATGNTMAQCLAVEELHRDEGPAILLAYFIDGAYVRVVEGRCCLRLALKTKEGLGVLSDVIG